MVQLNFERSPPVRQGQLWMTKLNFFEKNVLMNILTMQVRFTYCPMFQGHLKCFISYSFTSIKTFNLKKKYKYFLFPPDFGKK